MSDVPKYRENGRDKAERLGLDKPHIYWSRNIKEWLSTGSDEESLDFTIEQDRRWTPVQKD